jgi:hypothetical protein
MAEAAPTVAEVLMAEAAPTVAEVLMAEVAHTVEEIPTVVPGHHVLVVVVASVVVVGGENAGQRQPWSATLRFGQREVLSALVDVGLLRLMLMRRKGCFNMESPIKSSHHF